MEGKTIQFPSSHDESQDSSMAWGGLIEDGKKAYKETQLQQFISRHIRDEEVEEGLRGIVRGVYFSSKKIVYCERCKREHRKLILSDRLARMALNEFYLEVQISFSEWVNKQSKKFQQGLHSATDSITLVPSDIIDKIIKERHEVAYGKT